MVTRHGIDMDVKLKKLAVLGLLAALSACAADNGRYPSLALRPFETGAAPVSTAPETVAPIRPLTSPATIAALRGRAQSAHAAFLAQESATAPLARAASGQSVETNARAAALVAMADLSTKRGATSAVLADLDLLTVDAATALSADPALSATQAEVAALLAREDAAMARLWEAMGR